MLTVFYTPTFIRSLKRLPRTLQDEAIEKIESFKDPKNHPSLRVHKLKGYLKNRYSFSVNYRYRIVFTYEKKAEAVLHIIGDHSVYDS